MAYYTRQESGFLAFGAVERGKVFPHDRLQKEKKVLKEYVDAIIVEWDRFVDKFWESSTLLSIAKVIVEPFEYFDTLVENEGLLVQELTKKNESLAFSLALVSKIKVALYEASQSLDYAWKKIEEHKTSLKESQEGRKIAEDELREMHLENLALFNKYAKSLEENYFITQDSFENALW